MALSVLICDDSRLARNQLARSLPSEWEIDISFACNGQEAIEKIEQGAGELVFLDLNMPVMDGYETLAKIKERDLPAMVIVVSGDIQAQAKEKVMALGAMDFIEKPIHLPTLFSVLRQYGIFDGEISSDENQQQSLSSLEITEEVDKLELFQEMVNVAMGAAGSKLSTILNQFINLPVPQVNYIAASEIAMAINSIRQNASVSGISQGFVSKGVNGEAILIFDDADFNNILSLLNYPDASDDDSYQLEALMDIGNILIGACVLALGEQTHLQFSFTHPVVLGQHMFLERLLETNVNRAKRVLAMEVGYTIDNLDIKFELLLLLPESSVDELSGRFFVGKAS